MNERAASDEVSDLIRELAVEHGVALDRSDPILVLQTATRRILQNALAQAQAAQAAALQQHRAELELAAAKWREDSKRTASQLLEQVGAAIAASVERERKESALSTTAQLGQVLKSHEKALARSTLTCALAAAVVVLAAAAFVWASDHASEHPARHGQLDGQIHGQIDRAALGSARAAVGSTHPQSRSDGGSRCSS